MKKKRRSTHKRKKDKDLLLKEVLSEGYLPKEKRFVVEEIVTRRIYSSADQESVMHALQQISQNSPRFTEEELDRIAEKVAERIIHYAPDNATETEKIGWGRKLRDLAYDITIELIASGLYSALIYTMAHISFFAGPGDEDKARRKAYEFREIRGRIVLGDDYWRWDIAKEENQWYEDFSSAHDYLLRDLAKNELAPSIWQLIKNHDLHKIWFKEAVIKEWKDVDEGWSAKNIFMIVNSELQGQLEEKVRQKYDIERAT